MSPCATTQVSCRNADCCEQAACLTLLPVLQPSGSQATTNQGYCLKGCWGISAKQTPGDNCSGSKADTRFCCSLYLICACCLKPANSSPSRHLQAVVSAFFTHLQRFVFTARTCHWLSSLHHSQQRPSEAFGFCAF